MLFNKINVNWAIECELKTATKIIANQLYDKMYLQMNLQWPYSDPVAVQFVQYS